MNLDIHTIFKNWCEIGRENRCDIQKRLGHMFVHHLSRYALYFYHTSRIDSKISGTKCEKIRHGLPVKRAHFTQ